MVVNTSPAEEKPIKKLNWNTFYGYNIERIFEVLYSTNESSSSSTSEKILVHAVLLPMQYNLFDTIQDVAIKPSRNICSHLQTLDSSLL